MFAYGGNARANHTDYFRPSARLSLLRRQAARPPKKAPASVNTQMVMVTAYSLVVIMPVLYFCGILFNPAISQLSESSVFRCGISRV
jgi:hypothetical protein